MSDQDDEKKIVNEESSQSNDENQPKIDSNDSTNPRRVQILRQLLREMRIKIKMLTKIKN